MIIDETPPPSKTSPLVDDDLDEEEAIKVIEKKSLENDIEDETLEIDEIVNVKESKNHPLENVIGNLNQITLSSQAQNQSNFFCFISTIEPKNVNEALKDESWIIAMQEELNQFIANDVWELVSHPKSTKIIGTKWVYRNKLDENGVVSRNKARLVAQGYNQQEGIDYDEPCAPIARLESIRILIAYVCALDFILFQMDVKSAFLNDFINEEVYVAQLPGFIDFEKPNHVYKIKKAFYGLKQALKASIGTDNPRPEYYGRAVITRSCVPLSCGYPTHDIEDLDLDIEEDPEEDLEEHDMDVAEVIPPAVAPPVGSSPITPPPLSESSSDFDSVAHVTADGTSWVAPSGSTFEIEGPSFVSFAPQHLLRHEVGRLRKDTETLYGSVRTLTRGMKTRRTEITTIRTGVDRIRRHMDAFNIDIALVEQATTRVEQDRIRDKAEIQRLSAQVESAEVSVTLAAMDRDHIERELYWIRGWFSGLQLEIIRRGAMEVYPSKSIDVLAVYGDA
ncbi:retrovirus-related pol polyprotein from transposon TNT 1-94 [Tanacetum coccineum]